MEKPKRRSRRPEPPNFIRHCETLSPKETDQVVDAVAELIVNHVQKQGRDSLKAGQAQAKDPDKGEAGIRGSGSWAIKRWPGQPPGQRAGSRGELLARPSSSPPSGGGASR